MATLQYEGKFTQDTKVVLVMDSGTRYEKYTKGAQHWLTREYSVEHACIFTGLEGVLKEVYYYQGDILMSYRNMIASGIQFYLGPMDTLTLVDSVSASVE